ncbi:hypothetical protein BDV29DRAFT_155997 [Aspergillus leporis]|uniref:Uncharacterized protein n=1 Tax=Aspergillus leporis TaxID=41062 RepID=A0A5N5X4T5_9EURO|nr:hypothetical protein BDV29DRAFT_155997 [Aspergillus leporis]
MAVAPLLKWGPDCSPTALSVLNKLVILKPCISWESDPNAPEDITKYAAIGASNRYPHGAAQDYVAVRVRDRTPGRNILVTGIGGGIALQVLQIGVAIGCPAHGEFFVQLVDGETKDIPSQAMFVKGKGYVKILKVTLR